MEVTAAEVARSLYPRLEAHTTLVRIRAPGPQDNQREYTVHPGRTGRNHGVPGAASLLAIGSVVLTPGDPRVALGDRHVSLRAQELALLELLIGVCDCGRQVW